MIWNLWWLALLLQRISAAVNEANATDTSTTTPPADVNDLTDDEFRTVKGFKFYDEEKVMMVYGHTACFLSGEIEEVALLGLPSVQVLREPYVEARKNYQSVVQAVLPNIRQGYTVIFLGHSMFATVSQILLCMMYDDFGPDLLHGKLLVYGFNSLVLGSEELARRFDDELGHMVYNIHDSRDPMQYYGPPGFWTVGSPCPVSLSHVDSNFHSLLSLVTGLELASESSTDAKSWLELIEASYIQDDIVMQDPGLQYMVSPLNTVLMEACQTFQGPVVVIMLPAAGKIVLVHEDLVNDEKIPSVLVPGQRALNCTVVSSHHAVPDFSEFLTWAESSDLVTVIDYDVFSIAPHSAILPDIDADEQLKPFAISFTFVPVQLNWHAFWHSLQLCRLIFNGQMMLLNHQIPFDTAIYSAVDLVYVALDLGENFDDEEVLQRLPKLATPRPVSRSAVVERPRRREMPNVEERPEDVNKALSARKDNDLARATTPSTEGQSNRVPPSPLVNLPVQTANVVRSPSSLSSSTLTAIRRAPSTPPRFAAAVPGSSVTKGTINTDRTIRNNRALGIYGHTRLYTTRQDSFKETEHFDIHRKTNEDGSSEVFAKFRTIEGVDTVQTGKFNKKRFLFVHYGYKLYEDMEKLTKRLISKETTGTVHILKKPDGSETITYKPDLSRVGNTFKTHGPNIPFPDMNLPHSSRYKFIWHYYDNDISPNSVITLNVYNPTTGMMVDTRDEYQVIVRQKLLDEVKTKNGKDMLSWVGLPQSEHPCESSAVIADNHLHEVNQSMPGGAPIAHFSRTIDGRDVKLTTFWQKLRVYNDNVNSANNTNTATVHGTYSIDLNSPKLNASVNSSGGRLFNFRGNTVECFINDVPYQRDIGSFSAQGPVNGLDQIVPEHSIQKKPEYKEFQNIVRMTGPNGAPIVTNLTPRNLQRALNIENLVEALEKYGIILNDPRCTVNDAIKHSTRWDPVNGSPAKPNLDQQLSFKIIVKDEVMTWQSFRQLFWQPHQQDSNGLEFQEVVNKYWNYLEVDASGHRDSTTPNLTVVDKRIVEERIRRYHAVGMAAVDMMTVKPGEKLRTDFAAKAGGLDAQTMVKLQELFCGETEYVASLSKLLRTFKGGATECTVFIGISVLNHIQRHSDNTDTWFFGLLSQRVQHLSGESHDVQQIVSQVSGPTRPETSHQHTYRGHLDLTKIDSNGLFLDSSTEIGKLDPKDGGPQRESNNKVTRWNAGGQAALISCGESLAQLWERLFNTKEDELALKNKERMAWFMSLKGASAFLRSMQVHLSNHQSKYAKLVKFAVHLTSRNLLDPVQFKKGTDKLELACKARNKEDWGWEMVECSAAVAGEVMAKTPLNATAYVAGQAMSSIIKAGRYGFLVLCQNTEIAGSERWKCQARKWCPRDARICPEGGTCPWKCSLDNVKESVICTAVGGSTACVLGAKATAVAAGIVSAPLALTFGFFALLGTGIVTYYTTSTASQLAKKTGIINGPAELDRLRERYLFAYKKGIFEEALIEFELTYADFEKDGFNVLRKKMNKKLVALHTDAIPVQNEIHETIDKTVKKSPEYIGANENERKKMVDDARQKLKAEYTRKFIELKARMDCLGLLAEEIKLMESGIKIVSGINAASEIKALPSDKPADDTTQKNEEKPAAAPEETKFRYGEWSRDALARTFHALASISITPYIQAIFSLNILQDNAAGRLERRYALKSPHDFIKLIEKYNVVIHPYTEMVQKDFLAFLESFSAKDSFGMSSFAGIIAEKMREEAGSYLNGKKERVQLDYETLKTDYVARRTAELNQTPRNPAPKTYIKSSISMSRMNYGSSDFMAWLLMDMALLCPYQSLSLPSKDLTMARISLTKGNHSDLKQTFNPIVPKFHISTKSGDTLFEDWSKDPFTGDLPLTRADGKIRLWGYIQEGALDSEDPTKLTQTPSLTYSLTPGSFIRIDGASMIKLRRNVTLSSLQVTKCMYALYTLSLYDTPVQHVSSEVLPMAGFVNEGATCYFNSLMQCFFQNVGIRSHMSRFRKFGTLFAVTSPLRQAGPSISAREQLAELGITGDSLSIQEDVHEFFLGLVQSFKLQAKFSLVTKRARNGSAEVQTESSFDLALPIKKSVQEAIYSYTEPEILEDNSTITASIVTVPEVLAVVLQRSTVIPGTDFYYRNTTRMEVEESIALPLIDGSEAIYDLESVIVHKGDDRTIEFGHFFAVCRGNREHPWIRFDDEVATSAQLNDYVEGSESIRMCFYHLRPQ